MLSRLAVASSRIYGAHGPVHNNALTLLSSSLSIMETPCGGGSGQGQEVKDATQRVAFVVGYLGDNFKGAACEFQGSDNSTTRYSRSSLEGVLFRAIDSARGISSQSTEGVSGAGAEAGTGGGTEGGGNSKYDEMGEASESKEERGRVFRKRPARRGFGVGKGGGLEQESFAEAGRAPAFSRAGRTDRGFHAEGNVIAMQVERTAGEEEAEGAGKDGKGERHFVERVNAFLAQEGLGDEVKLLERVAVTNQFHAKNSSDSKRYD
eukprot:2201879-Rhodomonas_salina.1